MAFLSFDFRKTDRTMPVLTHPAGRMAWSPETRAALHVDRAEQISSRQLASLMDQVQSVTREAREIVVRRSRADLTTRLKPSSWSVAQCLDHLALTTRAFLPAISDALATASNLTTNRPLGTGILARLLILPRLFGSTSFPNLDRSVKISIPLGVASWSRNLTSWTPYPRQPALPLTK
jgi:hypothetical protein